MFYTDYGKLHRLLYSIENDIKNCLPTVGFT